MGFNYRRSVNLGRGLRLNLSKGGPSLSGGPRGARFSTRSGWRFSLPGTGLSYRRPRRK